MKNICIDEKVKKLKEKYIKEYPEKANIKGKSIEELQQLFDHYIAYMKLNLYGKL